MLVFIPELWFIWLALARLSLPDGASNIMKSVQTLAAWSQVAATVFAALGLAFTGYQMLQTRQEAQATRSYEIQKDGRELLRTISLDSEVFSYIYENDVNKLYSADVIRRARMPIIQLVNFYASIFRQLNKEAIDQGIWKSANMEFCNLMRSPPIQLFWLERSDKGAYPGDFKKVAQKCLNEARR